MSTNIVKSADDCYFFFNATCTKGDACPFRHSNAAYGSDVVCSFWREGKCFKGISCKYRHMEIRKTRNMVECFFERQPGGCKKPHCPFLHSSRSQTSRSTGEDGDGINSELVDPQITSSEQFNSKSISSLTDPETKGGEGVGCGGGGGELTITSETNPNESYLKPCSTPPFSPNSLTTKLLPTSPSSTAATIGSEPVSFSIDIAEESENEPEDIGHLERKSVKLTSSNQNIEKNFGIKTLEQIRMEKVFRSNDVNKQTSEPEHSGSSSKQFRVKLKRKSISTNSNTITSTSPGGLSTITTNTTAVNENESKLSNPGFGIKSLDEIRREKEQNIQTSSIKMSTDCEKEDDKPKKVIKIKRTHIEINKPSEPPSKVVKINTLPVYGHESVSTNPVTKCNLSPIKATTSTKVQSQSPQRKQIRLTPPTPKQTSTCSDSLKSPKQSLRLKLKSTPKLTATPKPESIAEPVPVKQLEVKSPKVKLQLKKLTISPKKESTIKIDDNEQNSTNLSNSTDRDKNESLETVNSLCSINQQQQDDYNVITDDDYDDDFKDGEYNSESSSNLSLKLEDKPIEKRIITSPSKSQDESKEKERIVDDDLTGNMEQSNSPSKNDDDLLEEDDLLADGESAPDDVAIEDEDDEFLKEIEHVINS